MEEANANMRLLEQQLRAIKAEAKVGLIDGAFAEPTEIERCVFAAEAARKVAAQRLSGAQGEDCEACHASVAYAKEVVGKARQALGAQRTKLKVNVLAFNVCTAECQLPKKTISPKCGKQNHEENAHPKHHSEHQRCRRQGQSSRARQTCCDLSSDVVGHWHASPCLGKIT